MNWEWTKNELKFNEKLIENELKLNWEWIETKLRVRNKFITSYGWTFI
jgi:hypothetical protein